MMNEIRTIHAVSNPIETLFVLDSMMGQDAIKTAKGFNEIIPLTGIILSKMDGDARGGAALSVKFILEKPIKFIASGEKVTALAVLGMGIVLIGAWLTSRPDKQIA